MGIRIDSDNNGKFEYSPAPNTWVEFANGKYSDQTWFHIKIEFDCVDETIDIYIDEKKEVEDGSFVQSVSNVSLIQIRSGYSGRSGSFFFDAVSFSWDLNYNIGDNLNEGLLLSFENSTSLDWIGYSLDRQANKTILGDTTIPMPADGSHTIQVFGTDSSGNSYQSDVRQFTVGGILDTDGDGLSDDDENNIYFTNPNNDDTDDDNVSDYDEVITHSTDPNDNDTDNDNLSDYAEINTYSTNPKSNDTDNDDLSDYDEITTHQTNPLSSDSDSDALSDYDEIITYLTDPNDSDSDDDDLSDYSEIMTYLTDPLNSDTDGDEFNDGEEVVNETDPNNALSNILMTNIMVMAVVIVVIVASITSVFLYLHLTKETRRRKKQEIIDKIEKEKREIEERKRLEREKIEREKLERERAYKERVEKEKQKRIAKEKEIIEKIRKMMSVSTRIKLNMMRNALNMDEKTFDNKIFDWASEFGFTIDGEYLIIKQETVTDFINELDRQFESWREEEYEKTRKI